MTVTEKTPARAPTAPPRNRSGKIRIGVIAPAARGSIGDQAMLEAVRSYLTGRDDVELTMLFRRTWAVTPLKEPARTRRFLLSSVKPVMTAQSQWIKWSFSDLWIIGADIIDGVYEQNYILSLLRFLADARAQGLNTGVFGSSISENPKQPIMNFFGEHPDIHFMARDGRSRDRFANAARRSVDCVADLAFLMKPALRAANGRTVDAWIEQQKSEGRRVLAVNSSGHTNRDIRDISVATQIQIFERWLESDADRTLLFFPHDVRPPPIGDEAIVGEIFKSLKEKFVNRVCLLESPFDAWDVKALLAKVDGVVTGRMHAAIAALGGGVAPLCIVYQGKFEGLMDHFELEGLCFPPTIFTDGEALWDALCDYETRGPGLNAQAAAKLPDVKALAERNFTPVLGAS